MIILLTIRQNIIIIQYRKKRQLNRRLQCHDFFKIIKRIFAGLINGGLLHFLRVSFSTLQLEEILKIDLGLIKQP